MRKRPITFREKVEARFIRRGGGACWMWEGSLAHGKPAINLREVRRYIWEWERGPIPPGFRLRRRDHRFPECRELGFQCRHQLCVNPWHLEPADRGRIPESEWDGTRTDHTLRYLNTQRARQGRRKKEAHDRDGNPQGDHAVGGGDAGEGPGMAQSGVG